MQAKLEQRSFLLLLALVTLLFFYVLKPFFGAIFWACAIAIIFYPIQTRLTARWGKRPNLTALTTLLFCVILVIIPTLFVIASFVHEGVQLYNKIQDGDLEPENFLARISETIPFAAATMETLGIDIENLKEQAVDTFMKGGQFFAEKALSIGQNTFRFLLQFVLMLYLAFFLLRDGDYLRSSGFWGCRPRCSGP